jgi:hypothetical protein
MRSVTYSMGVSLDGYIAGPAAAPGTRTGCHCACGKPWRVISR